MEIPLPPSPARRDSNEYSPTQITSPHSDDDESTNPQLLHSSSQDASPSSSLPKSPSKKSSKTKKKMANILKSFKLSTTNKNYSAPPKRSASSSTSIVIGNSRSSFSSHHQEQDDLDDSVDGLLEADFKLSNEDKAAKYKDKLLLREKERERERKLNIESIMEEETKEKREIPKLDAMPNKAGSTYQRTRSAAGPVELDLHNQKKAEEKAAKLAASYVNVPKGPVGLDNFGFVVAQRPAAIEKPVDTNEPKKSRQRSREYNI